VLGILDQSPFPSSVLDIGVGFGKYGVLLRDHLDIRKRRYNKSEWQVKIDGVEIWEPYRTPLHDHVYNTVFYKDIRELLPSLGVYDLVVMADVIEHLEKKEGLHILRKLFNEHCKTAMSVSYPPVMGREGAHWENPHETHKCIWTPKDFESFKNVVYKGSQVAHIFKGD